MNTVRIIVDGTPYANIRVNPATLFELRFVDQEVEEEVYKEDYDRIVKRLDPVEVQALFNELDKEADEHPPNTRRLYLALYRRLHG